MRTVISICLAVLFGGCACGERYDMPERLIVRFHVSGTKVIIDDVDTSWRSDSKEYESAVYWYERGFDAVLEGKLEFVTWNGTAIGKAGERGYRRGAEDALEYLKKVRASLTEESRTGS